ncbi:MAG TPA: hypothetical protein PKW45_10100 [Bryobacteraceae bacterium]|nr:hypothetical protein [Bryobacteraceae bacterium]HOQ44834.1 hypothetical protein [Bryobacteraceae bacterium]
MSPLKKLAYWSLPPLACLALYRPGLRAWFQQDDFAWLALSGSVKDASTLLSALFAPMAQGTLRPLSERAFFMLFHAAFGLWATPFRAFVFLTQFANLILLGALVERVSKSRAAGFLAAMFWALNGGLAMAMSWTSAYNQVLCGFFMLLALNCFVRYTETGGRRYLAAQWAAFLLGFGALEINAVYPALAAAYALCRARACLRKTWPMFAVSAAYTIVHFWVAAPVRNPAPAYAMHFDLSLFSTLWTYWAWALGPARLPDLAVGTPEWIGTAGTALLTVWLAGFAVARALRREWAALLPLSWFVAVLAPVLPFRDHRMSYYLTLPTAGVAWLAALAVTHAFQRRWYYKAPAAALAGIYLASGIAGGRLEMRPVVLRSHAVQALLWGTVRVRELHPGKAIILKGLHSDVFWAGVFPRPFQLVGVDDVYMAPEAELEIKPHPEVGRISECVIPPGILLKLLEENRAVVYTLEDGRLRALTMAYAVTARHRWKREEPRRVEVGQPSFAGQLGPTWYELDSGYRWMPRQASVRLGGPRSESERIYLRGYCPPEQTAKGPLQIAVEADGILLGVRPITKGGTEFELDFEVPPQLIGKDTVDVSLTVDRTFRTEGDVRELGLVFGTVEIR